MEDYKVHEDAPGISGSLVEGRICYDAFVLENKTKAIYYQQNYSYAGIIESLSGAPFDVRFISFDDIRKNPKALDDIDVILNVGDAYTAYSGGENWADERITTAIKRFVHRGGGFIGVGEPAAYQREGRFFQLSSILG